MTHPSGVTRWFDIAVRAQRAAENRCITCGRHTLNTPCGPDE